MNIARTVEQAEALRHLNDADQVFLRLSLSRESDDGYICRSLIVDVLPTSWLNSSDSSLLEPWKKLSLVRDNGSVFFYCGWCRSDAIKGWFDRPNVCSIEVPDHTMEGSTRQIPFRLPEIHSNITAIQLPSYALHGLDLLPYPFTYYTLYRTPPYAVTNQDYEDVIFDAEVYRTFREAQASLLWAITDPNARLRTDDLFAFRVLDIRGWLISVRVLPDKLAVTVGATDAFYTGRVVVQGAGWTDSVTINSHQLSLKLPEHIEGDVEVAVVLNNKRLDTAFFSGVNSLYPKNSPQVIVERKDVHGYVESAPENTPSQSYRSIFISYRRDDSSGHAGRLRADLIARYGADSVFMDLGIEPGADFVNVITKAVSSCAVLLAVIGKDWLSVTDASSGKQRLFDPKDYVRLEIATAIRLGVYVIPVLVNKASMPKARDLPRNLQPLAQRNALEITDVRWDYDLHRLMETLDKHVGNSL